MTHSYLSISTGVDACLPYASSIFVILVAGACLGKVFFSPKKTTIVVVPQAWTQPKGGDDTMMEGRGEDGGLNRSERRSDLRTQTEPAKLRKLSS